MNINWRPYQLDCKRAIKNAMDKGINKQLIVAATGTGKRLMSISLMQHFPRALFIAHREELIQQAFDEIETFWPFQGGVIKGPRFDIDKRIVVASIQTLYNRLDKIDPNSFPLIIIDECFPSGTKIDGKNIEDYQFGDTVNSFNHDKNIVEKRYVMKVMKRKYSKKLYDFGDFKCTPNHPIFINEIGYCLAKEIYYAYICDIMMRYGIKITTKSFVFKLWHRIFFRKFWNDTRNIHEFSTERFRLLLNKMQEGIFQQSSFNDNEQNKQEVLFRTNEEKQSNVQSKICNKDEGITQRKNFSKSWWKWRTYQTTINNSSIDKSSDGISNNSKKSNVIGKIITKLLQGRFGLSRSKTRDRDRWENSPIKTLEILRQTKDGCVEKSRLDYIKVYKSRSRQQSSKDCKENYVYNLEVEENNNYFANSILVHNCHHYASKTYIKTIQHFNPRLLTGWTATPKRLDGLSLSNIFQEKVFEYNIEDGIKDEFLAPIEAFQIKTPVDISSVKRTAGDFNQKELSEKVDSVNRNNLIVAKYLEYAEGKQTVAFCVDIDHCYHLKEAFLERSVSCEVIVSDENRCPNRTQIVKDFKTGKFLVLINVTIATEGFDYSDVGCVLMGRPTQSTTIYVQCIGRGTRLKSRAFQEKFKTDKCIILDFVDNTGKLSLINAYELEKDMPIENRLFLPAEYKEKLIEAREKRIIKVQISQGKDTKINLLRLPEVKIWDSAKMLEPATEKQLAWLKQIGVWQEGMDYTKAMASELISDQPAAPWQIIWLAGQKYDTSGRVTIGQYQKVKFILENRTKYQMQK